MPFVLLEVLEVAIGLTLFGQFGSDLPVLRSMLGSDVVRRFQKAFRIASVATAVVSVIIGLWLLSTDPNREWVVKLRQPGTIIPVGLGLAVVLYRLRGEQPLFYGLLEVIFGGGVIVVTAHRPPTDLIAMVVTIAGAVYVIVRGLDNMDKGLPEPLRRYWDRAFPKRPIKTQPETPQAKTRQRVSPPKAV